MEQVREGATMTMTEESGRAGPGLGAERRGTDICDTFISNI